MPNPVTLEPATDVPIVRKLRKLRAQKKETIFAQLEAHRSNGLHVRSLHVHSLRWCKTHNRDCVRKRFGVNKKGENRLFLFEANGCCCSGHLVNLLLGYTSGVHLWFKYGRRRRTCPRLVVYCSYYVFLIHLPILR